MPLAKQTHVDSSKAGFKLKRQLKFPPHIGLSQVQKGQYKKVKREIGKRHQAGNPLQNMISSNIYNFQI